jgi:hypothetical protein
MEVCALHRLQKLLSAAIGVAGAAAVCVAAEGGGEVARSEGRHADAVQQARTIVSSGEYQTQLPYTEAKQMETGQRDGREVERSLTRAGGSSQARGRGGGGDSLGGPGHDPAGAREPRVCGEGDGVLARGLAWVALACVLAWAGVWLARETRTLRRREAVVRRDSWPDRSARPEGAPLGDSQAGALADQGLLAEAAHALLQAAVRHLVTSRRAAVSSATTSREIVRQLANDHGLRGSFVVLVVAVEHSLFGGLPVTQDDYLRCRDAYEVVVGGDG